MKARPTPSAAPARQAGQATVEFIVVAATMVPLLIGVALIGKYIDLMQTAEQASRYVAFEAAVRNSSSSWKSDAELAVELRRRFFGTSQAPVKTGDVAGNFPSHRNPLWSDPAGRPLIDTFEQGVDVRSRVDAASPLSSASFASALGLPRANLYTASVIVRPADVRNFSPFDKLGLSISRRTLLLSDPWTARSADSARSAIEGAGAAVYPIGTIKALVNAAGQLPTLVFDPALRVGDFDWDVVPCDRLIGGC